MSKPQSWKSKYEELKGWKTVLNTTVTIIDRPLNGFMFKSTDKNQGVIWVKPSLTYRQKIMALAHEYGHFAKFVPGKGLVEKKNGAYANEQDAHHTAMVISDKFGISQWEYIGFATGRNK